MQKATGSVLPAASQFHTKINNNMGRCINYICKIILIVYKLLSFTYCYYVLMIQGACIVKRDYFYVQLP